MRKVRKSQMFDYLISVIVTRFGQRRLPIPLLRMLQFSNMVLNAQLESNPVISSARTARASREV